MKKNRLLSIVISVVMVIAMMPAMAFADDDTASSFPSISTIGTGTAVNGYTYSISSQAEMDTFVSYVNSGRNTAGVTFKVTGSADNEDTSVSYSVSEVIAKDATVTSASTNSPTIADTVTGFAGVFDGGGYTFNLSISTSSSATGMFGYVTSTGTVKNLKTTGSVTVSGTKDAVGGVAGYNSGIITNVTNAAVVTASSSYNVGGIAGFNNGYYNTNAPAAISQSNNIAAVTGGSKVGGITGENSGTVDQCMNTGNITGSVSSKNGVGGIVGRAGNNNTALETSVISDCYNTGNISCSGGKWVGGICGFENSLSSCINCYNVGNIYGSSYLDHIAGKKEGTVTNCYGLTGAAGVQNYDGALKREDTAMKSSTFLTEISAGATGIWTQVTGQYPTLIKCGVGSSVTYTFTVTDEPALTYSAGATFSTSGMKVHAVGSDGSTADITSGFTASSTAALTVNDTDVIVFGAYNGCPFAFSFEILVGSKSDTVTLGGTSGTYNNLKAAVMHLNDTAENPQVVVMGTTELSGTVAINEDVEVVRDSEFTGTMFNVTGGSVSLSTMTIDGMIGTAKTGTLFNVTGGTLSLKGSVKLQNCETAVVLNGGNVAVNRATIDAGSYSVKVSTSASKFTLQNYVSTTGTGTTSITGNVYLCSGAYITIKAAVPCSIVVESEDAVSGTVIGVGADYTPTEADADKFSTPDGGAMTLDSDGSIVISES